MLRNVKLAIPVIVLAALLLFISPPQANAKVHFGVYVGPPVYSYPYPYTYAYPYAYNGYPYPYGAYPTYGYPYYGGIGVYSYPHYHWGHDHHVWREYRGHDEGHVRHR